jgi:hypothetical protein
VSHCQKYRGWSQAVSRLRSNDELKRIEMIISTNITGLSLSGKCLNRWTGQQIVRERWAELGKRTAKARLRKVTLLVLICLSAILPIFGLAKENSKTFNRTKSVLCDKTEKVVFSCQLENKKTVSLCSSPNLSKSTGYMVYRYGSNMKSIELAYPEIDALNQSNSTIHLEDYFRLDISRIPNDSKASIVFYVDSFGYALGTGHSYFLYDGRKRVKNYLAVWDERGITRAIHRCIEETVIEDIFSLKLIFKKN